MLATVLTDTRDRHGWAERLTIEVAGSGRQAAGEAAQTEKADPGGAVAGLEPSVVRAVDVVVCDGEDAVGAVLTAAGAGARALHDLAEIAEAEDLEEQDLEEFRRTVEDAAEELLRRLVAG